VNAPHKRHGLPGQVARVQTMLPGSAGFCRIVDPVAGRFLAPNRSMKTPPAAHRRAIRRQSLFDAGVRRAQRRFRQRLLPFIVGGSLGNLATAPIVYSLLLPFVLLDAWVWLYQFLAFPVYSIPRIRRRPYFAFDRERLAYLNAIERMNCFYCSYANGLIAYVREVAAHTEQYWCPIKHARRVRHAHSHYANFLEFGDAAAYRRELPALRRALNTRR